MTLSHKSLRQFLRAGLVAALLTASGGNAFAEELEILHLKGGDRLSGYNRGLTAAAVKWELPHGELLSIPLPSVERIAYPADPAVEAKLGERAKNASPPEHETEGSWLYRESANLYRAACGRYRHYCDLAFEEAVKWTRRIELGTRFRDGNSEEDFINVGGLFERVDENQMLSFDLGGQYGYVNGRPSENRWFGNSTIDVSREGNWILFLTNRNEFDEFEDLDYRGTLAGGLGYRFFNEKQRRLILRVGPGVTFEKFHAPAEGQTRNLQRTTPDVLGEAEFRWPLFDRTRFEHKTTVNPSAEDFDVFRVVSDYGLLVQLDQGEHWSLKLDVRHEYNSKPNKNRRHSDFTTSVLLLYEMK